MAKFSREFIKEIRRERLREGRNESANLLGNHGLRAYCVLKAYKEESAYTKYELLTLINHTDYQLIKYLVYAVYAKINKKINY